MVRLLALLPLVWVTGCPASPEGPVDAGGALDAPLADAGPAADAPTAPDAPSPAVDAPTGADTPSPDAPSEPDAPPILHRDVRCGDPVPEGATPPVLRPYSGAACPALVPGRNTIESGGRTRQFLLVVPTDLGPDERLPVLVMWHWLGGSANSMLTRGQVQVAADELRFIAIIPEKTGDVTIPIPFVDPIDMVWPYLDFTSDARFEEELVFFDDLVACVSGAYAIDEHCISTVGVSAGALWTGQLLQHRSDVLASAIVLSGGVGPASGLSFFDVRGFTEEPRPLPTLIAWGGPLDQCALRFETASQNLEVELEARGGFLVECVHDCGHTEPPVEETMLGLGVLYRFAVDHPFWLAPGESPYFVRGLPSDTPTWCAIGAGNATPRRGMCPSALDSCPVPALPPGL